MIMKKIEQRINYRFKNKNLLQEALTHSSFTGNDIDNERLEFLGDAVLELVISEYLYSNYPFKEGVMTRLRANIVCSESLTMAAKNLGLGEYLIMGKGELVTGGRRRKSNLSNAFEAVVGAVFLDSDYENTKGVVLHALKKNISLSLDGKLVKDYKTELQEYIQQYEKNMLEYSLVKSEGPEHDKTFYIQLQHNKKIVSEGSGKSKKEAEQNAAKAYLAQCTERDTQRAKGKKHVSKRIRDKGL